MSSEHILVVIANDDEPEYPDYRVECPGVTESCRAWRECGCPESASDDFWDIAEAHGVEHARIDGVWMVRSDRCFVVTADDMHEAAQDLGLPEGRWPIRFTVEDDGTRLVLERVA